MNASDASEPSLRRNSYIFICCVVPLRCVKKSHKKTPNWCVREKSEREREQASLSPSLPFLSSHATVGCVFYCCVFVLRRLEDYISLPRGFGLSLSEQPGSSRAYTCRCSWTRVVRDESNRDFKDIRNQEA